MWCSGCTRDEEEEPLVTSRGYIAISGVLHVLEQFALIGTWPPAGNQSNDQKLVTSLSPLNTSC